MGIACCLPTCRGFKFALTFQEDLEVDPQA